MEVVEINEQEINKAANVLVQAFENDPIFRYIFNTTEKYREGAPWLFSTWVRWSIMFGKAWMTVDGNGVVLMRSMENPEMSFVSMVRAGMLLTPFKLGWGAFKRFYFDIVAALDKKHAEIMGDTPHWYGWMIGVHPEHRGIGRALLKHCEDQADKARLPVFLETATKDNLSIYSHKKFEVSDTVNIPNGNFTLYFMVRQPQLV